MKRCCLVESIKSSSGEIGAAKELHASFIDIYARYVSVFPLISPLQPMTGMKKTQSQKKSNAVGNANESTKQTKQKKKASGTAKKYNGWTIFMQVQTVSC